MNDRYLRSFQTLGLSPDCHWTDVRHSYRTLSRQWHPDRHTVESSKAQANERMKEINSAYAELSTYYRTHGSLPPVTSDDDISRLDNASTIYATAPVDDATAAEAPWASETKTTHAIHRPRRFRSILVLAVALSAGFIYIEIRPSETELPQPVESANDAIPSPDLIPAPPVENRFSTGSTMQDVLAAEGAPTRAENNVWHYGESKVMFSNGVVLSWIEHPRRPLKIRPAADSGGLAFAGTFGKGSTTAEVRAIQGDPMRSHDMVWEYGASRVYFENGRVSSWYESPLNPLKTRK